MILIKHVLAAIPLYTLSLLNPPKQVLKRLEQLMSVFFWGASNGTAKRHWLSWDKLCYPKEENGLAFRKLREVQRVFGCKLWWKFQKGSSLWANFIAAKYTRDFAHASLSTPRQSDSPIWRRML